MCKYFVKLMFQTVNSSQIGQYIVDHPISLSDDTIKNLKEIKTVSVDNSTINIVYQMVSYG